MSVRKVQRQEFEVPKPNEIEYPRIKIGAWVKPKIYNQVAAAAMRRGMSISMWIAEVLEACS